MKKNIDKYWNISSAVNFYENWGYFVPYLDLASEIKKTTINRPKTLQDCIKMIEEELKN